MLLADELADLRLVIILIQPRTTCLGNTVTYRELDPRQSSQTYPQDNLIGTAVTLLSGECRLRQVGSKANQNKSLAITQWQFLDLSLFHSKLSAFLSSLLQLSSLLTRSHHLINVMYFVECVCGGIKAHVPVYIASYAHFIPNLGWAPSTFFLRQSFSLAECLSISTGGLTSNLKDYSAPSSSSRTICV